ncbi:DNA repair metallo-beta-lactamase-domain-containing protein [Zychaea mexicana]|uniref:DNA repair metallo-beta-lactamase-domain-containing protein n=1 Tax=Zychaea mexicana TaxID=64656 RepID=UPI0022FDF1AB|nr:DNA repair metallo-beta-lactamase-domain-containing protein [Zychaea mexicana]KAI9492605.1 DNA repair metallo-beta-lactamase-domain-containing protein [Zychaea mexicana]
MKRKRPGNDDRPTESNTRSLDHYFANSAPSTVKVSDTATTATDSFDNDLERAIQQSLQEINTTHIETAETTSEAVERLDRQEPLSNSLKQCPICDVLLDQTADANSHINSCLDSFERTGCPNKENASIEAGAIKATTKTTQAENESEPSFSSSSSTTNSVPKLEALHEPKRAPALDLLQRDTGKGKDIDSDQKPDSSPSMRPKRKCPFYKWIQGIPFVVDAFSFGKIENCQGYFLSHYHSDHYYGLSPSWSHGPIYCSKITANFVRQELNVDSNYVVTLPMDQEYALSSTVNVSLIDANHCPGSVLFLFKVYRADGTVARHLHTGDFRANPRMCLHPLLRQPENGVLDTLYLDTTYLNGQYSFPAQEEAINAACDLAERCASGEQKESKRGLLQGWLSKLGADASMPSDTVGSSMGFPGTGPASKVLFIVGTYSIGKERMFYNLAKRLNSKVYASPRKLRFITSQENKELDSLLTDDPLKAQVHLFPMGQIQEERLSLYLKTYHPHFTSAVAFRPTGWTFKKSSPAIAALSDAPLAQVTAPPADRSVVLKPMKTTIDTIQIYGIPYSEHSSFRELASFVGSLEIRRIIPTVNVGSEDSRRKMNTILDRWQNEKKKKGTKLVPYPTEEHW